MSSVQRNAKIYGAVETETFMTFQGFCKKIYDTTQQEIEIFIDDKKIDTLLANEKIPNIEDKYEVFDTNGFCFNYKLPKEYIGGKHKLEFKTLDGEQLVHSPIVTVDSSNEKYNEYLFLESLNEPIDTEKIKDIYCPNSIGFLATEENLEDEEFVQYIKELIIRFPNVEFKAFCLNDEQKKLGKNIFLNNKINFLIPQNIYEIAKEIEIYLCSQKVPKDVKIFSILRINSPQILSLYTNLQINNFKQMNIKNFEKILSAPLQKFMDNFKILGYTEDELSIDRTYTKTFQKAVYKRFHLGESILDDNINAYEYFNFRVVEYALKNKQFKKFYFDMVLGQIEVLFGGKI